MMRRKAKLVWIEQAEGDLLEIRAHIAKDQPPTAARFVKRLRKSVDRLRYFPEMGWVIAEAKMPTIREIVFGDVRIVYHYAGDRVTILTVRHGARLLHWD